MTIKLNNLNYIGYKVKIIIIPFIFQYENEQNDSILIIIFKIS